MMPLERVERELAELKTLPDIMRRASRPAGMVHLGPWAALDEHTKHLLLGCLDWSSVDPAERQRIMEREVDYEVIHADIFYPYRRKGA
jgi:hypothetical protein